MSAKKNAIQNRQLKNVNEMKRTYEITKTVLDLLCNI